VTSAVANVKAHRNAEGALCLPDPAQSHAEQEVCVREPPARLWRGFWKRRYRDLALVGIAAIALLGLTVNLIGATPLLEASGQVDRFKGQEATAFGGSARRLVNKATMAASTSKAASGTWSSIPLACRWVFR
jgi:hypothetical protein